MLFNKKNQIAILLIVLSQFALANEEDHSADHEDHGEVAKFTESEIKEFELQVLPAAEGLVGAEVRLHGEIGVNEEEVAHISARFAGLVKKVHVRQGQWVSAGQILAVVENSSSLSNFSVSTEKAGIVLFKQATEGEVIESGQEMFQVVDFSSVWVEFGVYQKDVQKIKRGQSVRIVDPFSGIETTASLNYVSPIMNESSRTVTVRAVIENRNDQWKPGMFVTGFVAVDVKKAEIRIPTTALHHFEEKTVVFVEDEDGFEPRPVVLGVSNELFVEVVDGLKVGERYVAKNGFVIKAELEKSTMSDGHSH